MDILIEQELALHRFEVRQNQQEVNRLIHPSFREVGESGKSYDFETTMEMMKKEKPSHGYIHAQDFESLALNDGVYLLLYKSAWVHSNGSRSNFAKRSSIWTLVEDNWQMTYHQGTPCERFNIARPKIAVAS